MKEITYVWHDPTEIPTKEGRYLVTNIVGSVCIASYGKYRELENYNYYDCKKKYCAEEYVDSELEPVSTGWYCEIEHYDDMDDTCFYDMGCDPGDIVAWTEFPAPYDKKKDREDTPVDFTEQVDSIMDASSVKFTSTKDDAVKYVSDIFKKAQETGEEVPYDIIKLFL